MDSCPRNGRDPQSALPAIVNEINTSISFGIINPAHLIRPKPGHRTAVSSRCIILFLYEFSFPGVTGDHFDLKGLGSRLGFLDVQHKTYGFHPPRPDSKDETWSLASLSDHVCPVLARKPTRRRTMPLGLRSNRGHLETIIHTT